MTSTLHARIAALVVLLVACAGQDKSPSQDRKSSTGTTVAIGAPLPEYRSVSLAGDSVSLSQLRGKVVVLNVWATWCHPCRREIPELVAIDSQYRSRGLETIGVSVDTDGSDDAIRDFMKEFAMRYPVWRDPDERISAQYLIVGVPATFLVDREGILRWRLTGPIAPGDTTLRAAIERALGT